MKNNSYLDQSSPGRISKDSTPNQTLPPRPRILVVDDEFDARVLASRVLAGAGFDVTTVPSGFECLEQFWRRPHWFDLIVLDLSMPFLDGEATFSRLRAIKPDVVVLLCTGFFAQAHGRVDRMRAAGLAGLIRKPHRPDELVNQVQATLDRARMSRAALVTA